MEITAFNITFNSGLLFGVQGAKGEASHDLHPFCATEIMILTLFCGATGTTIHPLPFHLPVLWCYFSQPSRPIPSGDAAVGEGKVKEARVCVYYWGVIGDEGKGKGRDE